MDSVYGTVYYACLLLSALALVVGLVLYAFQDKMIYQPNPLVMNSPTPDTNPPPYRSPTDREMPYDNISIRTADSVKLHGWLIKSQEPRSPTIIYFQANAGNMGFRLDVFERLVKIARVNILAVSYRGYGFSEGIPSENGLLADADATLKYAFGSNLVSGGLFIMGASLGGAVSIYAAAIHRDLPIKGVILENTFSSLPALVDVIMPAISFLKSLVLRNYWPSIDRIPLVRAPILFIAGKKDELVPHGQMIALKQAATNASFIDWVISTQFEVEEGEHNTTWIAAGEAYPRRIRQFIDRSLMS